MKSSLQALFDKALQRVTKQGCRSRGTTTGSFLIHGSGCLYRGMEGRKCAVGHLMTNKQMKKYNIVEGTIPFQFDQKLLKELAPKTNLADVKDFLLDLRTAHDQSPDESREGFISRFHHVMRAVAAKWHLKMP